MNKQVSPKIVALTFGVLVICFAIAFYVVAWQEPTESPPEGNVATPLNTSNVGQSKEGGLILNTGGAENALIIDQGNLCFGGVCRSSWPEGGVADLRNIQVTPIDWDAIRICQAGTCCAPWRDCDGDGRTYVDRNDCDEGCSTCYTGSAAYTTTLDGKDQDCDGTIDEKIGGGETYSKACTFLYNLARDDVESSCSDYCLSLGYAYQSISGCSPLPFLGDVFYRYSWGISWADCTCVNCLNDDPPQCYITFDGPALCAGGEWPGPRICNCTKPDRYQ